MVQHFGTSLRPGCARVWLWQDTVRYAETLHRLFDYPVHYFLQFLCGCFRRWVASPLSGLDLFWAGPSSLWVILPCRGSSSWCWLLPPSSPSCSSTGRMTAILCTPTVIVFFLNFIPFSRLLHRGWWMLNVYKITRS